MDKYSSHFSTHHYSIFITRTLRKRIPPPRQVIMSKWEGWIFFVFHDPDHSQNLIGSKVYFFKKKSKQMCVTLLTNKESYGQTEKQTNGKESNTSLVEVMKCSK